MGIFEAITAERARQRRLWDHEGPWGRGDCSSHDVADVVKVAVLTEECGEVAAAVLEKLEPRDLQRELVQVAAVCVAWLEALEGGMPLGQPAEDDRTREVT